MVNSPCTIDEYNAVLEAHTQACLADRAIAAAIVPNVAKRTRPQLRFGHNGLEVCDGPRILSINLSTATATIVNA